jgi:hypothetical protein
VLRKLARHGAEVGVGRHFERQHHAALGVALVELNGELPDLAGEEGAVLFAFGQHQAQHLRVIIDHLLQVGRLECGVSDAPGLYHRALLPRFVAGYGRRNQSPLPTELKGSGQEVEMTRWSRWSCQAVPIAVWSRHNFIRE